MFPGVQATWAESVLTSAELYYGLDTEIERLFVTASYHNIKVDEISEQGCPHPVSDVKSLGVQDRLRDCGEAKAPEQH